MIFDWNSIYYLKWINTLVSNSFKGTKEFDVHTYKDKIFIIKFMMDKSSYFMKILPEFIYQSMIL